MVSQFGKVRLGLVSVIMYFLSDIFNSSIVLLKEISFRKNVLFFFHKTAWIAKYTSCLRKKLSLPSAFLLKALFHLIFVFQRKKFDFYYRTLSLLQLSTRIQFLLFVFFSIAPLAIFLLSHSPQAKVLNFFPPTESSAAAAWQPGSQACIYQQNTLLLLWLL